MSGTKKTKWEITSTLVGTEESGVKINDGEIMIFFNNAEGSEENAFKQARLICKAPEMLEEIKHLVRALKTVSSFGATTSIIEHAEKLIKEATELK